MYHLPQRHKHLQYWDGTARQQIGLPPGILIQTLHHCCIPAFHDMFLKYAPVKRECYVRKNLRRGFRSYQYSTCHIFRQAVFRVLRLFGLCRHLPHNPGRGQRTVRRHPADIYPLSVQLPLQKRRGLDPDPVLLLHQRARDLKYKRPL